MKFNRATGFTLFELLLVVVIAAIMATAGVQLLGGQSVEKQIEKQSQKLIKQLNFMCEKAIFEHRPFAIEFSSNAHQLITFRKQKWWTVEESKWPVQPMNEDLEWQLYLQGKLQTLSNEFIEQPHIICYNNGQISAFELLLSNKTNTDSQFTYQLTTKNPTQLKSGWLDE